MTLGSEYPQFRPLELAERIPVVQGPQGGFHILVDVEVVGLEVRSNRVDEDPIIDIELLGNNALIAGFQGQRRAFLQNDWGGYLVGETVVFQDMEIPSDQFDAIYDLRVVVSDRCGVTVSSTSSVMLDYL